MHFIHQGCTEADGILNLIETAKNLMEAVIKIVPRIAYLMNWKTEVHKFHINSVVQSLKLNFINFRLEKCAVWSVKRARHQTPTYEGN